MKARDYVQAAVLVSTALVAANCKGRAAKKSLSASSSDTLSSGPVEQPVAVDASAAGWVKQHDLPWIEAKRVILLTAPINVPQFSTVGPVVDDDIALIGSSQLGFAALRWRDGSIAWSKPGGMHLAPPLMMQGSWQLISDCPRSVDAVDDQVILGCLRTVTREGIDLSLMPIVGARAELSEFAETSGPQQTWMIDRSSRSGPVMLGWQRGETAVSIDSVTGKASITSRRANEIYANIKGEQVGFALEEEQLVARRVYVTQGSERGPLLQGDFPVPSSAAEPPNSPHRVLLARGPELWRLNDRFVAVVGVIGGTRYEAPMVRLVRIGTRLNPRGEIDLLDVDATGSKHGQAAFPTPGIALLGRHSSTDGATALAVRVDTSLQHDLVIGYSATAERRWAFALPEIPRADPVGVAVAGDAVLIFHDGNRVSILPTLH
jgi:hypothetical protein